MPEGGAEAAEVAPEQLFHPLSHGLIEGRPDLRGAQPLGQVLGGQEAFPDRLADAPGEPGLVLGDGALHEEGADPHRLVRVEQHPDGDGIGEAARDRPDPDRQCALDECIGVHGQEYTGFPTASFGEGRRELALRP